MQMKILRDYCDHVIDEYLIDNSTFLKLVKILTFNDMRSVTAVDYVTGMLLHDHFHMVRRIMRTINNEVFEKLLLLRAEKVILFLKSKFPKDLTKDGITHLVINWIMACAENIKLKIFFTCVLNVKFYFFLRYEPTYRRKARFVIG